MNMNTNTNTNTSMNINSAKSFTNKMNFTAVANPLREQASKAEEKFEAIVYSLEESMLSKSRTKKERNAIKKFAKETRKMVHALAKETRSQAKALENVAKDRVREEARIVFMGVDKKPLKRTRRARSSGRSSVRNFLKSESKKGTLKTNDIINSYND